MSEMEVILTGEQYYCQTFVEKVRQNDGNPIMAYGKLCHTFPEAREALCKGVKKIFKEWKQKFLVVQKVKPKSPGTKKEQAEHRKARDETCLALLKEKWATQYASMLALGKAIEKAKCKGNCKRTLDWRFFISLYKKWSGGDADADLKAFMKHMKTGKCGACGLAVKQSKNSSGTIEGMKKLLKKLLDAHMKTFNFGLVEPVASAVPLSSIQFDHVLSEDKGFRVSDMTQWPADNIDLVLEEFLKVVPSDSASHALKSKACGDAGQGGPRAAYDAALEPHRQAVRKINAGYRAKNKRLGLALRTANQADLAAMGLPKLLEEVNKSIMFGTFGSCAATGCDKNFVATPEEATASVNNLHVGGCDGDHTTKAKDQRRTFGKLFSGTTKLSTTVKYLKEEIAKGMANVCNSCHCKKTHTKINIYKGQRPRGTPEAIARYYKENPKERPAVKRKRATGKGKGKGKRWRV